MHSASNRARAGIAVVALGVAAVVVAIAARAPLSRSRPVDATALQAPTIAVFTLIGGVGVVMLGALAILAWSGRRRKDEPPERQPPPIEVHWIWKLLAILLLLALGAALVVAAVTGSEPAKNASPLGSGLGGGGFGQLAGRRGKAAPGFVVPSWLPWTLLGSVAVAAATGIILLWLRRSRPLAAPPEASAASAAVEAAIGALDAEADPRRAVIAAYGAMQWTLGEQGVARGPSEAPREYLQRVLVASRANEREAKTLTGLFEEARYSTHPIPERLREVALAALRSLRGRLRAEGTR